MAAAVAQDLIVADSPTDSVTSIHFAPAIGGAANDFLCASSWDSSVCVYEVNANGEVAPRAKNPQAAPVLATAWNSDRTRITLGGCEQVVKIWDMQSQQTINIGQHAAPIKVVLDLSAVSAQAAASQSSLPNLVTGGWDKKMKYWDTRAPSANGASPLELDVPDKVYCADSGGWVLVVATAERHIVVYDLRKPNVVFKSIPSPLKFQSRCISLFPDTAGFALGSIEGRVAIHYLNEDKEKNNFAFKCHRSEKGDVFAVNQIVWHEKYSTFATLGGDGTFVYWDPVAKNRLKAFPLHKNAVLCGTFNPSHSILAYAVGYDWSRGMEAAEQKKAPNYIALHKVVESEIAPRPK